MPRRNKCKHVARTLRCPAIPCKPTLQYPAKQTPTSHCKTTVSIHPKSDNVMETALRRLAMALTPHQLAGHMLVMMVSRPWRPLGVLSRLRRSLEGPESGGNKGSQESPKGAQEGSKSGTKMRPCCQRRGPPLAARWRSGCSTHPRPPPPSL